jgi:hypothetical protein
MKTSDRKRVLKPVLKTGLEDPFETGLEIAT